MCRWSFTQRSQKWHLTSSSTSGVSLQLAVLSETLAGYHLMYPNNSAMRKFAISSAWRHWLPCCEHTCRHAFARQL